MADQRSFSDALDAVFSNGTPPSGLQDAGNIDLAARPVVNNPDGSISTVRSMSFNEDGQEVLIPTVADDGSRILSDDEAVDQYRRTGKFLGKFDTPDNATAYAEQLHSDQEQRYNPDFMRALDVVLGQQKEENDARLSAVLSSVARVNPDKYASALALSKASGLPVDLVERNFDEVARAQQIRDLKALASRSPVLAQQLLDPQFAALAKDNGGPLSEIEKQFGTIRATPQPENTVANWARGLWSSFTESMKRVRLNVQLEGADLFGGNSSATEIRRADLLRSIAASQARADGAMPDIDSTVARDIYGGMASTLQQLPGLGMAVLTRNPEFALASAGFQAQTEAYGKYRVRGGTPGEATLGSGLEGAIEIGTEAIPMGFFVDRFGKEGMRAFIGGLLAREVPTEIAATIGQSAVDTAIANPSTSWGDYIDSLPADIRSTFIATVTQSMLTGGAGALAYRLSGERARVRAAQDNAAAVEQLKQITAAMNLSKRDVSSAQNFLDAVAANGPLENIYLDAQRLQQSDVDLGKLAQVLPSAADQIGPALATGDDIVIPVGEFLTRIQGSDLDALVTPHIRTSPDALSVDDANRFVASETANMQAAAAQIVAEREQDTTWQSEVAQVEQHFADQLAQAGRFSPDVNSAYAGVLRDFFTTMAARTGRTPAQMLAEFPLQVRAEGIPGDQRLNQEAVDGNHTPAAVPGVSGGQDLLTTVAGQRASAGWAAATVVRRPDDRPAAVYRAGRAVTPGDFDGAAGRLSGGPAGHGLGVWFTSEQREAAENGAVTPYYLDLRNPFPTTLADLPSFDTTAQAAAWRDELRAQGYDGVVIDERERGGPVQFVAFAPEAVIQAPPSEPLNVGALSRGQEDGTGRRLEGRADVPGRADAQGRDGLSGTSAERPDRVGDSPRGDNRGSGGISEARRLAPLEGAPAVPGFHGPDPRLVAVAEQYAHDHGIDFKRQAVYVEVDVERAARIAAAYDAMEHAPQDPKVKEAYANLIQQTVAQYRALESAGYRFWFIDINSPEGQDYTASPWNAMRDIRANQSMGVFPTAEGFGSDETFNPEENPLTADTGIQWPFGSPNGPLKPALANDLFRAVHDAFGHGLEGAGFRARGEENAWQAHVRLFTGSAVGAITSETRGQNSWLNYGPHGEHNRTASTEDTHFADQKTGLMPEWTWQEGIAPNEENDERNVLAQPVLPPGQVTLVHYSNQADLAQTDPSKHGTGYKGAERQRKEAYPDLYVDRTYFGIVGVEKPYVRESGLGSHAYHTTMDSADLYDFAGDPDGLGAQAMAEAKQDPDTFHLFTRRQSIYERMVRDAGYKGYYVGNVAAVFEPVAVQKGNAVGQDESRGELSFGNDITQSPSVITLFQKANLSTLLHELGHFQLEVLANLAARPNAPTSIAADMQTVLKWFSPNLTLDQWRGMSLDEKRQYHEQFARGFEAYLFEGRAPTPELKTMFQRFAAWLRRVYQNIARLNVEVSPEVKAVFDRMLASEQAIAEAQAASSMTPAFTSAEAMGTDAEGFTAYQALGQEATDTATDTLQQRSLRDMRYAGNARDKFIKEMQKSTARIRKALRDEVQAEVRQQPIYKAMHFLRRGEMVSDTGEQIKANIGYKLDRAALAEMYPESMLSRPDLSRLRGMTRKDGLHPDLVAEMFGFQSGDQLVRNIIDATPESEYVEAETDARMLERHGDISSPEALARAADEAIHNDVRARFVATEIKAAVKSVGPVRALTAAAKEYAERMIASKRIKDLRPRQHAAAEGRAAKAALDALAKNDMQGFAVQKRNQLVQIQATKLAYDAQNEMAAMLRRWSQIVRRTDERAGKSYDIDMLNAVRAILGQYGIAPRTGERALDYLGKVKNYDPDMYAVVEDSVMRAEANAQPFDELTVEDARALRDEIDALLHLARRSKQMEVDGDLIDRQEVEEAMRARMEEIGLPDVAPGQLSAITPKEQAIIRLKTFRAAARRVESWVGEIDGGESGPFRRFMWNRVKDAATAYRADKAKYLTQLRDLLNGVAPSLKPLRIEAPELNYTFGKDTANSATAEILHALLHTGNDSNKRKLLLGRNWAVEREDGTLDTSRWDAFIKRMIDEGRLTKAHYDFAQGVWDLLESLKPLAQKTHRDVFGKYFDEITATPFTTPFGEYRGGYVPAKADTRVVGDAAMRDLIERENASMAYAFPATAKGFTKGRVEYNRPLMLDLRTLAQHVDQVLLFSHMEMPVRDVTRVLKSVQGTLYRLDPTALSGMLTPWLNRAARQQVVTPVAGDAGMSRFWTVLRSRAGAAAMFANLSNAAQQITGFSLAAVKVKPSLMMSSMADYMKGPRDYARAVAEASPFMADRMGNTIGHLADDINEILLNPSKLQQAQNWTMRHAYFLQQAVDNVMSPVIWQAAYNQHVEQGHNHDDAVRFADGVIRQTQGSQLPEDVSRIETGPAFVRLFTQFAGYFNMQANLLGTEFATLARDYGLRKGAARGFFVLTAGFLVPAIVAEGIAQVFRGGPGDDDDDGYMDDWLAALSLGVLRNATAMVPVAGQLANAAVNSWNNKPYDDRLATAPAISMIENAVRAPVSVSKAAFGSGSVQKAVRDVASLVGISVGLPAPVAARPLSYAAGMASGEVSPTGVLDAARGLATGTASQESKR
ncbi:hypothetical protein G3T20_05315 [Bordetella hinzii]|uniref:hypothetical protein n=1 Tax=Bordetella hinzii TaxID=103855 RepID=UPI0013EFEC23|nr:hypothetical protein [Bordetella hinzii]QII84171.1 hypothetical protein G3T20_05315 [Bordetella hinzii]